MLKQKLYTVEKLLVIYSKFQEINEQKCIDLEDRANHVQIL